MRDQDLRAVKELLGINLELQNGDLLVCPNCGGVCAISKVGRLKNESVCLKEDFLYHSDDFVIAGNSDGTCGWCKRTFVNPNKMWVAGMDGTPKLISVNPDAPFYMPLDPDKNFKFVVYGKR